MKPYFALFLLVSVPVLAVPVNRKPVSPARPTQSATATSPNKAQIEAAVRTKVEAYYKGRSIGSDKIKVATVTVQITQTTPMQGWSGRWRSSGTALLRLGGPRIAEADRSQARSFDATVTVSDSGVIGEVDVTGT